MSKAAFVVFSSTVLLFGSLAFAQDLGALGCGDDNAKFAVKSEKGQHKLQTEPGKALVYFIQDDSDFSKLPRPTTRMGIDGKWVGATHSNSYSYFSVDPGIHHICAAWQPTNLDHGIAALHFTAEAGAVYFFGVKNRVTGISFAPLDSDEGKFLVSRYALSTSHPKK